jgi:hypothetical protein
MATNARLRLVVSRGACIRRAPVSDPWRALCGWIWVGYLVAFGWGLVWLFR